MDDMGGGDDSVPTRELKEADLKERAKLIRELMAGRGPETSSLLANQLAAIENLPDRLVTDMLLFIDRATPSDQASERRRSVSQSVRVDRLCQYRHNAMLSAR